MKKKKLQGYHYLLLSSALLASGNCFGHVRWFVEKSTTSESFSLDVLSALIVFGASLFCLACYAVNRYFAETSIVHRPLSIKGMEWSILKACLSIMLIGNIVSDIFIAPNLIDIEFNESYGLVAQAALVVALAFGETIFAAVLAVVLMILLYVFGFALAIDYAVEFIAVAISFAMIGYYSHWHSGKVDKEVLFKNAGVILRIGVGLQLIVLAVHNKLIDPNLALGFLAQYPEFNLMTLIGITQYTDLHFVLSGGMAELAFGLMLTFNIASRLVSCCVFGCFFLTSIVLGLHELLGHIPILACLVVMIVNGGAKLSFSFNLKDILAGFKAPSANVTSKA